MTIEQDELQAKEFLKRTEIITMKKDLRKLREFDALAERNKIVSSGFAKPAPKVAKQEELKEIKEKFEREKVLNENYFQEIEAEKQLKNYADEEEKQQIFILDSQKLELEKKAKEERSKQEPELVIKKNDLNLEKKEIAKKLDVIKQDEEKLEGEQIIISEKEKTTNIPSEREGLEKRRQELEDKRQELEKKRWEVEREVSKKDEEIIAVDESYKKMIEEENNTKEKIANTDKQLRQIYSQIIQRVHELKNKEDEEKRTAQSEIAKTEAKEKEKIQREQWTHSPSMANPEKEFLKGVSLSAKENLEKQTQIEEEQRKQFLKNIETKATEEENKK